MESDRMLRAAKRGGRATFRALGRLTANWRPLPDFLIIGAKRSGTTSLYRWLLTHPGVLPMFPSAARLPMAADMKAAHYFDREYWRGEQWYRSHFPTVTARARAAGAAGSPVVSGEAAPYYLFHPLAAERAAAAVPDARIIVLLRDPVARTWSHWKEQRRNGVEPLSFEEALEAEPARLAGEEERLRASPRARSFAHEHHSYVGHSEYAPQLRRWLDHYARDDVLICRSEDLYAHPQATYDQVVRFLGLRVHPLADVSPWNAATGAPMSVTTARRLEAHFEPFNRELAEMIGFDPAWHGTRQALTGAGSTAAPDPLPETTS